MARIARFTGAMAAGLAILVVAGCQSGQREPGTGPDRPGPIVRPPGTATASAAAYLAAAASIDLFEIQSSQLALTRSRNAKHREFAAMMIRAHNGTAAQLSLAGRRLNLLPAAALLPRHQGMLAELAASGDFDAVYHRQQVAVHEAALRLHGDFATRGDSPTLRPVARNAAPIVRSHLEMLRRM
jgi:putative membrane protein